MLGHPELCGSSLWASWKRKKRGGVEFPQQLDWGDHLLLESYLPLVT